MDDPNLAYSLCFLVVSVTPAQYFSKRRGLANGIVFASGGLGGAVISLATNGLITALDPAWTFRVVGLMTMVICLPAACLIKERTPIRRPVMVEWTLFRDLKFIVLFLAGAIATFPILVPPFFLPLFGQSLGLTTGTSTGLLAGFNFASAVGRITSGFVADRIGPLNTLFLSMLVSALSMLALWPVSSSVAPLAVFAVVNGAANGGFFATSPTVAGNVFGSARVSVVLSMMVTGWAGGYLLVRFSYFSASSCMFANVRQGTTNRGVHTQCIWWRDGRVRGFQTGHLLRRVYGSWICDANCLRTDANQHQISPKDMTNSPASTFEHGGFV